MLLDCIYSLVHGMVFTDHVMVYTDHDVNRTNHAVVCRIYPIAKRIDKLPENYLCNSKEFLSPSQSELFTNPGLISTFAL